MYQQQIKFYLIGRASKKAKIHVFGLFDFSLALTVCHFFHSRGFKITTKVIHSNIFFSLHQLVPV